MAEAIDDAQKIVYCISDACEYHCSIYTVRTTVRAVLSKPIPCCSCVCVRPTDKCSQNCRMEAMYGHQAGVRMVPLLLEDGCECRLMPVEWLC